MTDDGFWEMSHEFYRYQTWRVIKKKKRSERLSDGGRATPLHMLNLASSTTVT